MLTKEDLGEFSDDELLDLKQDIEGIMAQRARRSRVDQRSAAAAETETAPETAPGTTERITE